MERVEKGVDNKKVLGMCYIEIKWVGTIFRTYILRV